MSGFSKKGPVESLVSQNGPVEWVLKRWTMDDDRTVCAATKLEAGEQLSPAAAAFLPALGTLLPPHPYCRSRLFNVGCENSTMKTFAVHFDLE